MVTLELTKDELNLLLAALLAASYKGDIVGLADDVIEKAKALKETGDG